MKPLQKIFIGIIILTILSIICFWNNKREDYLVIGSKESVSNAIEEYYKNNPINYTREIINVSDMKIIDKIAVYIKSKEGFKATAYKDNLQYSIGYGTRAKHKHEKITVKEANIRLYKHIKKTIIPVFAGVKFYSVEQVYSAIDFSYNVGHNAFKNDIVDEHGFIDCQK